MKIFFACGGSAGHINPAIAMAEYLKARWGDCSFLFFGRRGGMEERRTAELSLPFYPLDIRGLSRRPTLKNLGALSLAAKAQRELTALLAAERPALAIGTGGYACYPLLRAASRLGIPTLLHESNAIPGLAARLLSTKVDRVLLQYEACRAHLPRRADCTVIGAPLRRGFGGMSKSAAKRNLRLGERFCVLSFGGSQGAERINEACLSLLCRPSRGVSWVHICGEAHYAALHRRFPQAEKYGRLFPYITNMAEYMTAADLVICRAGALTLAELSALGKPAILIPSPYVPNDHQSKNAALYEEVGAACVVREDALSAAVLRERIEELRAHPDRLRAMGEAAHSLARADTEAAFTEMVSSYLSKASAAK